MLDDPIVNEVREIRRQIERDCGGTAEGYYAYIRKVQETMPDRLVRGEPKRIADLHKHANGGDGM